MTPAMAPMARASSVFKHGFGGRPDFSKIFEKKEIARLFHAAGAVSVISGEHEISG
jgi:hypothetical protein